MKYNDYVEKHKEIFEPIGETVVIISILGMLRSVAEEVGGDFADRIQEFCDNEIKLIGEREIKS